MIRRENRIDLDKLLSGKASDIGFHKLLQRSSFLSENKIFRFIKKRLIKKFSKLPYTEETRNKAETYYTENTNEYWDSTNRKISSNEVKNRTIEYVTRTIFIESLSGIEIIEMHKKSVRKWRLISWPIIILFFVAIQFLAFIPLLINYFVYKPKVRLPTDLMDLQDFARKGQFAQKNNYLFQPSILREDASSSYSENYWGFKEMDGKKYFFMSNSTINKTSQVGPKERKQFFFVKLIKKIDIEFRLYGRTILLGAGNKQINVESQKFNDLFKFHFIDSKVNVQQDVISTISPAIQIGLIDLKEIKGPFDVHFNKDSIDFYFEDISYDDDFNSIVEKVTTIAKYLD